MEPAKEFCRRRFCRITLFGLIIFLSLPAGAFCELIYQFERMWPTLQQPWYFESPHGIALDSKGNVTLADSGNHRILRFSANGQLITTWGHQGSGRDELSWPCGVAVDGAGDIYVLDTGNDRLRKFTPSGRFINGWGGRGRGEGKFADAVGLAVSETGYLYVADTGNHRIQKFTDRGGFLAAWGTRGQAEGQFREPSGIAVDAQENVYVADTGNCRIQKFTKDGAFLGSWGQRGEGDGEFLKPWGLGIDGAGHVIVTDCKNNRVQTFTADGAFVSARVTSKDVGGKWDGAVGVAADAQQNLFVVDTGGDRVQKFSAEGRFLMEWAASGSDSGQFVLPFGIASDSQGGFYVADGGNHRIQRFDSNGLLTGAWGKEGSGDGEFSWPTGVAVGLEGELYVVDSGNERIQRFDPTGRFLGQWGIWGTGEGEFWQPFGIAIDGAGNVYVTEVKNHRVQKFSPEGQFICAWGGEGKAQGEFCEPSGLAVDGSGNVVVADTGNHRVQRFTEAGEFLAQWGEAGSEDGQFNEPYDLAFDAAGNVFVADSQNARIQKFTPEGRFLARWGAGGGDPGCLYAPRGLEVAADGRIAVSDTDNHRIQVFREKNRASGNKAILVAGGGPYPGNHLWEATEVNANLAWQALKVQGFDETNLLYLSSDRSLDRVDADATLENLKDGLTRWASGAEDVVLYLSDHGGRETFRLNASETLSACELSSWLDTLQATLSGKLLLIYDACESGSFIEKLSKEGRILLTSTSPGEDAYFVNHGSISFSNFFWTNVFNGMDVYHAFSLAGDAMGYATAFQHPLLDDNGNGTGNDPGDGSLARKMLIGSGTRTYNGAPRLGKISPPRTITGSTAGIFARGVKDPDGVARVWAVVRPPDFTPKGTGNPINELPSFELKAEGSGRYEGAFEGFHTAGTYGIAVFAMDRIGNISIPRLTSVSVDSPLTRKAVLVAGGSPTDLLWPAIEKGMRSAYEGLKYQGYSSADLTILSPASLSGVDHETNLSTASNLEFALKTWAAGETQDLVLFMIGRGETQSFAMQGKESLAAADLDAWLDTLQESLAGPVTVIYDASFSGSFLPALLPPEGRRRILIASAQESGRACFASAGDLSFSRFFWTQVAGGANVREAFLEAKSSMRYTYPHQAASLDDNGNGIGNEKADGKLAEATTLGAGVVLAGDAPVVGSISPKQTLSGKASALLWARNVTATAPIEKVWAVITPPGFQTGSPSDPVTDLPALVLEPFLNGVYKATYSQFNAGGTYAIAIVARDENGSISIPKRTTVVRK